MQTLTQHLANELRDPRAKAIVAQLETELTLHTTLEIFFAAEIARALLRIENTDNLSEADRARITNEIRRNTAELRRLRADRPNRTETSQPEPKADSPEQRLKAVIHPSPNNPVHPPAETTEQTQLIPRGGPCPCRSGEKYKRCCGRGAPPQLNLSPQSAAPADSQWSTMKPAA